MRGEGRQRGVAGTRLRDAISEGEVTRRRGGKTEMFFSVLVDVIWTVKMRERKWLRNNRRYL